MLHNSQKDFLKRHIGPSDEDQNKMLKELNYKSLDDLIKSTVPEKIQLKDELNIGESNSEYEALRKLKAISKKNEIYSNFIGMGYYGTYTPYVILRNILENPGWYTSYTPYQAEIAQGRLEALLNFQTMVSDLTSMDLANASLLDEGTAAAEAMTMLYNCRSRQQKKANVKKLFVSQDCFPQTIDILKTRSEPLNIELVTGDCQTTTFDESYYAVLLQYPGKYGQVNNFQELSKDLKNKEIAIIVAADLLSLSLLTPPGEWGADVVVGTTQRFGIPLGYGGPHAAYFATQEKYKRNIPGRIIGVSEDNLSLVNCSENHMDVFENSNTLLPVFYKFSALWSAHEGSFLLMIFMLALCGSVNSVIIKNDRDLQFSNAVLSFIAFFYLVFLSLTSNPFQVFPYLPANGVDLNPLLQDPLLIIHPPMLFFGYVFYAVVFSFVISGIFNKFNKGLIQILKVWSGIAWATLSVGILLGSMWAYYELCLLYTSPSPRDRG